jgi:hypothetical protein
MESGLLTQAFRNNNPAHRRFARHLAGISALSVRGAIDERFGRAQLAELAPPVPEAIPRENNHSPDPAKRRFRSRAVEARLEAMRRRVGDVTLASLFWNRCPDTLDTTVEPGTFEGKPNTVVVIGDIPAMSLRDSSAQCHRIRLASGFWRATGYAAPFDAQWSQAKRLVVQTLRVEQRKDRSGRSSFQRSFPAPTGTLDEDGLGNAVNPTGLIASGFRRSDDACIFPFLVPLNSLPSHRYASWPQGRSNFLCRAEASLCMVRNLVRHRPAYLKGNHIRNFRLRILVQVSVQVRTDHQFGYSREADQ